MQDGNRAIVGTTALLRDVGEETALQEALDREQHASLLKDEFLSTAAHELRSPLTSIAGFASLLARTAPDHAELIEPIERNARDMQRLVEALLDQARLESGRFSVQPTRFRLAPAVAELLTDDAEHLGDPHVETVIPADLTIDMDRQAFTLVLRNLVSNAVKYGDGGTITISGQASPGAVAVSVADDGPGIPEEHQAHLFEPFFRVPGELWSIRGSGLGLSIVQRYVERHGGEITCRSTLGEGSTFTFVVPTIDGL
jgi:signal transduction histidine kinase